MVTPVDHELIRFSFDSRLIMIVDLNLEPLTNESVVFKQEEPPIWLCQQGKISS